MGAAAPVAAPPGAPMGCYRRRRARSTPLDRLVHAHWPAYQAVHEERFEPRHGRLRPEVTRTVEGFLRCGVLEFGLARVRCTDCGHDLLVAFSCKGRGALRRSTNSRASKTLDAGAKCLPAGTGSFPTTY